MSTGDGNGRTVCKGCGHYHGGINDQIHCLEKAIAREQQHPDRLLGIRIRTLREQVQAQPVTRGGFFDDMNQAGKKGAKRAT